MKRSLIILLLIIASATLLSQPRDRVARTPALNYDWRSGFISITEVTGALGLASNETELSKYYYGITTQAGYQFTRNIKAGIGLGVQNHNEGLLIPLFLDFRLSMNAQELVPFLGGSGGIMVDFEEIQATRVFINPSVGVRYVAAPRKAVTLSMGLMITTGGMHQRKSFINFKLGLELKGRKQ